MTCREDTAADSPAAAVKVQINGKPTIAVTYARSVKNFALADRRRGRPPRRGQGRGRLLRQRRDRRRLTARTVACRCSHGRGFRRPSRPRRLGRRLALPLPTRALLHGARLGRTWIAGRPSRLIEQTIGANFEATVAAYGENEALVEVASGRRWTYAELDADVNAFARGLMAAGIAKGDRVGVWAPNCAEWTIAQYATAKVGRDPGQRQPGVPHPRVLLRRRTSPACGC